MSNEKPKWIEEHKADIKLAVATIGFAAISVFVGYKLGVKRTGVRIRKGLNVYLPELINRAGHLGFVNTMETIEDTVPEAADMIVKHFDNCESAVTKTVAHRYFTDPEVKEAMKLAKELFR